MIFWILPGKLPSVKADAQRSTRLLKYSKTSLTELHSVTPNVLTHCVYLEITMIIKLNRPNIRAGSSILMKKYKNSRKHTQWRLDVEDVKEYIRILKCILKPILAFSNYIFCSVKVPTQLPDFLNIPWTLKNQLLTKKACILLHIYTSK